MSFSPQGFEWVWLEDGYGRICCTYCNKHSYEQFVTWFPPPFPIMIASEMECCHSLWITKRTPRSSVSCHSHSHDILWYYNVQILLHLYMHEIGLDCSQMPVPREGYAFNNKMCSIHIKGQTFKLLILITDALAQWRAGNARVTVSIHRNTFE